jgi:surface protein
MFYNCNLLLSLPDISKWDARNIEHNGYMFYNCNSLVSLPDISKWDTHDDIDKSCIFDNCLSILILQNKNKIKYDESTSKGINENDQNIKNNNKKESQNSIINIKLYIESGEINNDINLFKTEYFFLIDVYLDDKKINILKKNNKWKYKFNHEGEYNLKIFFNDIITSFESFFEKNNNLISVDLSEFNSSNVTNMRNMFKKCKKLKEIKGLNKIITKNVEDMSGMFQECKELESLDLTNINNYK